MLTDIDLEDIMFAYLKDSTLAQAVTGNVEKAPRTHNSTAEDIVISVLANTGGEIQGAYVNVNIFVADIEDADGQHQPNRIRMRTLSQLAAQVLNRKNAGSYIFTLDEQRVYEQSATCEHVINCRVKFKIINS